jgi:maltooligosyltrehalose trehalohydrolase
MEGTTADLERLACCHVMPFGAQLEGSGVRFRLWAPSAREVVLVMRREGEHTMQPRADGWREVFVTGAGAGTRYGFRIDGGLTVPDPASRFQPEGVHELSEVVDPADYVWRDGTWPGRSWDEAVIYELHVGTFTPEGTFRAAAAKLDHLAALGVTAVELMPLAQAPGARGWGYDGVLLFAPHASYGRPEDLKDLVAAAHARGLMVLLDVVYNHFGPEGNYLHVYAEHFFTERHKTPWGAAINFDGPDARWVREFFFHNALYWLEEFHFDGLRLDAIHAVHDDSPLHVVGELVERIAAAKFARPIHIVLENERDEAHGSRAQWNDPIHHALHVLLTGETDGYYAPFGSDPAAALGRALARSIGDYVGFLQNHDQIGNRALGERIVSLAPAAAVEAALAIVLLAPTPPLLFMGEEWGATQPFLYFCDFGPELAGKVREGRRAEFAKFEKFAGEVPDPTAEETFLRAKLDWSDPTVAQHSERLDYVRRLLTLRRAKIVPLRAGQGTFQPFEERGVEVCWPLSDGERLILLANLSSMWLPNIKRPAAAPLFATAPLSAEDDTALPPWWVGWFRC